mmetsp:Transcript_44289/g.142641  ORF Transcript_44289/g.142641 Transcript_44289/m.142641 type:complete len:110 (-) Transcript_44289:13-342(-)
MTNAPSSASDDDRAWRTFGCSPTVKQNSNSGRFDIECLYRKSNTHVKMSLNMLRTKGSTTSLARTARPPSSRETLAQRPQRWRQFRASWRGSLTASPPPALAAAPPPRL